MKKFLTIAICAAICSIHPAAISTGQFSEAPPARVEQTVLAATDSRFIVIDTRKLTEPLYVFHNDGNGWQISSAVGLGGTVPTDPDKPDPKPGTPLEQVKAAFGQDVATFEQQRGLMADMLTETLEEDMTESNTVDQIDAWVQRGFKIGVGDHADKWESWTAWYLDGASAANGSSAELLAWVRKAAESLR